MEQANGEGHGPTDIEAEWAEVNARLEQGADQAEPPSTTGGAAGGRADVVTGGGEAGDRASGTSGPAVGVADPGPASMSEVAEASGAPLVRRLGPAVAGLTALWLLRVFLRRRRRR